MEIDIFNGFPVQEIVKILIGNPVYMTDEFSKMIKGVVIPSKDSEVVVNGILDKWCVDFAGYPKKSFHADNGGEFVNSDLRAACRRSGINLTLIPSFSSFHPGRTEPTNVGMQL